MSGKRVVFLNGPMGVGKSTVGRLLQGALPQCAFIDGDWCLDLDPFVGNRETRAMAVEHILCLLAGYNRCSCCQGMVVAWLMDRPEVCAALEEGAAALGLEREWLVLSCTEQDLRRRWREDRLCPWRTEENLAASVASLQAFAAMPGARVETTGRTPRQVADGVLAFLREKERG